MGWISKLCLYVFVAVIAYLVFLPAFMPLGLTPFTKEYHEGYSDYMRGYSSRYNATRGNSFSFNPGFPVTHNEVGGLTSRHGTTVLVFLALRRRHPS